MQTAARKQADEQVYFSGVRPAQDHINALGLPNDGSGYNYDEHLRTMGGGTFIAKVRDQSDDGIVCLA